MRMRMWVGLDRRTFTLQALDLSLMRNLTRSLAWKLVKYADLDRDGHQNYERCLWMEITKRRISTLATTIRCYTTKLEQRK